MVEHFPQANRPADSLQLLRDEFRHHLESFYACLRLAPPYHTVEKAVAHLTAHLKGMEPAERDRIAADPGLRWAEYRRTFVESGLNQKHRGIIAGLARSSLVATLPEEYRQLLETFSA